MIKLDSGSSLWPRYRQQFVKGAYEVRLVGPEGPVAGLASYDSDADEVSFQPLAHLRRYSAYTAMLAVKPDFPTVHNQSGNASLSLGFRTGSDLHEPVRFKLGEVLGKPTVLSTGQIILQMTDDYGLPARGAEVMAQVISEYGLRLPGSAKAAPLAPDNSDQVTIVVSNREKETVLIGISVSGPYGVAYRAERSVTFLAGPPAAASFERLPDRVVVDQPLDLTAGIRDTYGNSVEYGERISLRVGDSGAGSVLTRGGTARFRYRSPVL